MKRVLLFVLTNILVVATLMILWTVVAAFLPGLRQGGFDLGTLAIFCLFWGMGGAFISLALSRILAKWMSGVVLVDPNSAQGDARWLVQTVHRLAREAGITEMPQVGIYESPEINAFATGPTKNRALVAVSSGLLNRMSHDEVEGVLGHEVSHAANGDMVTMTLIQGVVNAFVMFLSWIVTMAVMQALRGDRDRERGGFMDYMLSSLIHNLLSMALSLLAYVAILAPFSRWREFRADRGGAEKVGKAKMISALEALKGTLKVKDPEASPAMASFKINGGGWAAMFSTHPSLDDRIARLRELPIR